MQGVAAGRRPLALISGRVVRVGDTIDDFLVADIRGAGVTLVGPAGVRIDLVPGANPPPETATEQDRSRGERRSPATPAGRVLAHPDPSTTAARESEPVHAQGRRPDATGTDIRGMFESFRPSDPPAR